MLRRMIKRNNKKMEKVFHVENHGAFDSLVNYAAITKIDDDKRLVVGVVTKATLDNQNEIVEWDATVEAVNDFKKWMNLREMHDDKKASGIIEDIELDPKNKLVRVVAKVIDDDAWKKVKSGVYKGFSIGGKALKRIKEFVPALGKVVSKVKKYVLNEVSLVDRPAHPECLFEVVKRDGNYNDPLYREMVSAESKVPVFKSKILTDEEVARLPDRVFGLVKVRRTKDGLYKQRYYCMPDKIHAYSVLNILPNSSLKEKDKFKVHQKAAKILGKSHDSSSCPFCFEIKKMRLLSEVNQTMNMRKRRIAEAEALLKAAYESPDDEEYEATQPHDDPVESENLRDAKRKMINDDMPQSYQDDQEGGYEYYPADEE